MEEQKYSCHSLGDVVNQRSLLDDRIKLTDIARRYDGKLLLAEEYDLPREVFLQLVELQILSPVIPIRKTFFTTKCMRCHNGKKYLFATIDCARCQKRHLYCRNCIHMGRVMECTPLYEWTGESIVWPNYEKPCSWEGELTPTQHKAAMRMQEATIQNQTILTWAVTGSGKTEMLFPSIEVALKAGKRICIASPRADVVRELLPRLRQAFSKISIQGLYGGSRDKEGSAQLIIATTHQLFRFKHAFDLLIIDEVDAFPYHQDVSLQLAAERAKKLNSSLIFLTATPREEQRKQMAKKQLTYVFVPLRYHQQLLPIPKFQQAKPLEKCLTQQTLPKQFIHWLQNRQVPSRQLLIFVPTVQQTHQLQKLLQRTYALALSENIYIESVHAEDSNREKKIVDFRKRLIHVLITTTILERGVTFPAIDVVVLDAHHQVFDEAALVQISGRAGRSKEDPTGEIMFFHNGKTNSMVKAKEDMMEMNNRALSHKEGGVVNG